MDRLSPEQRSRLMGRIRGRDTKPERAVRSMVYSRGFRYRLHAASLPGRPDLVMARYRAAIFVHGCFWHAHGCRAGRARPKTNAAFWREKLETNRRRDRRAIAALRRRGWKVLVIWECQLREAERLGRRLDDWLARIASAITDPVTVPMRAIRTPSRRARRPAGGRASRPTRETRP